jgi:hypothetical protein
MIKKLAILYPVHDIDLIDLIDLIYEVSIFQL